MSTLSHTSKLPDCETTIFTTMSALAAEHQAINLGQGFPDFAPAAGLLQAVAQAMTEGHNQYAPMAGVLALRHALSDKIAATQGWRYDAVNEITVTAGATQALFTAMQAFVHAGDEVIIFDPCFDCYVPAITLCGGVATRLALTGGSSSSTTDIASTPEFEPDWLALERALSPRTRMVLVNTPHNPCGTTWTTAHWQRLADLLQAYPQVLVLSDEVYEHMVYDGLTHVGAASIAALRHKSIIVSSFGKTLHVTGWKIGSVAAPADLMAEFRKVHQFNVFCVNAPMQVGIAQWLQDASCWQTLSAFYQAKRDYFLQGLARTRLQALPCRGTYFVCASYADLSLPECALPERAFCTWLTQSIGVAAIPLSVFYADGRNQQLIRFCFAKKEATLAAALERLMALAPRST